MKAAFAIAWFACAAPLVRCDVILPEGFMTGETVDIDLGRDGAEVRAVFGYRRASKVSSDEVYFPLFGSSQEDPVRVLARSNAELYFNGEAAAPATPCPVPPGFNKLAFAGLTLFWFKVDIAELVAEYKRAKNAPPDKLEIELHYFQPLIGGRFYFLPTMGPPDPRPWRAREWSFQMHVHSPLRIPRVLSKQTDHQRLGNQEIIYLKSCELVELE
jgi:hypothetical protein